MRLPTRSVKPLSKAASDVGSRRDLQAGISQVKASSAAIRASDAVVVVFSARADGSPQVWREVDWAAEWTVPVICLVIGNAEPSESPQLFDHARSRWPDAFMLSFERPFPEFVESVRTVLSGPRSAKLYSLLRDGLEQRLADLVEEHQAVLRQLGFTLDAADRIRLQRRLSAIENDLAHAEQDLERPRITPAGRRIATRVQARALDAALPRHVVVGRPTELVAQVRLITSEGLKAILRVDRNYQVRGRDVVSRCFEVEFPVLEEDKLGAGTLTLTVDAPDFGVSSRTSVIIVQSDPDS